jgi:glycosyltransferase involved in cell wall biosynthesis
MPEVSVLMPCYNAAAFLVEALQSLFAQTYSDFEIIAIDDGSEDETVELLGKASRQDSRVHVVQQSHQGIAAALRAGTDLAQGTLIARMDADDISRSDRLMLQVHYLHEHPDVDVVSSCIRMFPREHLMDGLLRYENWVNRISTHEQILTELFVESPLPHPTVVIRKATLDRVQGYRDVDWPEDYDLWMRMARLGCRFAKVPEVLLAWRDWPGRASRVDDKFRAESFRSLKEHYLLATYLAEHAQYAIWGAGPIGKRWATALRDRGRPPRNFIDLDPKKIGKTIHGALVVAPSELDELRDTFILVAVGALSRHRTETDEGRWMAAREEIREQLNEAGFVERRDFVCIA